MTVEVEFFGGTEEEWDGFASHQEGFTHFHRLRWRAVMQRVFGHECLYLAARDWEGELIGVLPLVRVRSLVFGHYLVSMPFLNYGGPLGTSAGVRALVSEAMALAQRENVKLLELRSREPLPLSIPASHRKVTVLLDLAATADAQFKSFDSKLRSQIRRPQKKGVTVRFGADQISTFFSVFARHMRDLGTPTQSLSFFREISEQFGDDCWFGCAYLEGEPVAAGCGFRFGNEFEMTWASSLREFNRDAPNMLLYWAYMERAIEDGVTLFNFGRCSPGTGSHRFKLQWGGREQPLWWYDFAAKPNVTTPSPSDRGFRFGPQVWRRLPARIATAVGPLIVRYLP